MSRLSIVAVMALAGSVRAAIVISDGSTVYTQDFNTLPSSGTNLTWVNNSTISGWYRNYTGTAEPARDNTVQSTGVNGSGVSTQFGFMNTGVDGNTDRSVTLRAVSYVTNVAVGAVFQNNAGKAATGFSVGYTGEQWRRATNTASSLYFEYAVVSSLNEATLDIQADDLGWTRVSALEFVSPSVGTATGLNGSNPLFQTNFSSVAVNATITNGQYLVIRWLVTDSVNTHALGVDDVSVKLIPGGSPGFTAAYVVADFNDMARGAMTTNIQPAGTGQGFSSDHWETGTSVMTVTLGDLYAWTQTEYSVVQPGTSQCVRTTSGYDRRQARSLIPVSGAGHDIWFSFLVRNTEPTDVAGIDFLNDAVSYAVAATNNIYLQGQSLIVNGTVTDVSSKSFINENTLIVGKLTLGSVADPEGLSVWINPVLSSKAGLEAAAPAFHSDDLNWNISQLDVLGICSYDTREESSEGGMLDAIRISNGTDAFDFIKATSGTLPTNEISRVPMDLHTPLLITNAAPAPGLRVKVTNPEYAGTEVYHALYLPADWVPGKKYPVIVEYAGNGPFIDKYGDASSGAVESSNLGFGISGGNGFIWVCMPLVSSNHLKNELSWWGDIEASVDYCKTTVSNICRDFGGDSSQVFLAGFSRGAIACNYIGLHDDSIAALWRGFICHSHYDGVTETWPYPEADRASAAVRLARLGTRPQFISQENSTAGTKSYLDTAYPAGNFTFQPIPFRNHQDTWTLRDIPERTAVRNWINQLVSETNRGGFLLTGSAGANGTISPTNAVVPAGGSADFVITAAVYCRIATLTTNGTAVTGLVFSNSSTTANFTWTNVLADGTLAVTFTNQVATDPAGTPYEWLAGHGLTNYDVDAVADPDSDGLEAWQEYIAGTDPTNAASCLKAAQAVRNVITWTAQSNRIYSVYWSTNLIQGFQGLNTNILYPQSCYTNETPDSRVNHYQVMVRLE